MEVSSFRDILQYALFVEKVDNQWMVGSVISETKPFPIWRTDSLSPFDSLIFKDAQDKQDFLEDENPWLEPVQAYVRFFAPYRVSCVVTVEEIFEMTPGRYFIYPPKVREEHWVDDLIATKILTDEHSETHYPLTGFDQDFAQYHQMVLSEYGQAVMRWNAQVETAVHQISAQRPRHTVHGQRMTCTLADLYSLREELSVDLLAVPDNLQDPLLLFAWHYGPFSRSEMKTFEGVVYQLPTLPVRVPNLQRAMVVRTVPLDVVVGQMN